jgi:hypothetical protein
MINRRLEWMGYGMTEMEVVIHVLNNIPKEYESVVEGIDSDLDNINHVYLEKVKSKLRAKFVRLKTPQTPPRDLPRENDGATPTRSPSSVTYGACYVNQKGFKENCRKCGEHEHKAINCPQIREEM